ncbi:hypothetical protein RZE82_03565 [Mollicutes bacterium LVI A0039]|nr:hypothetical protein RZE82_03565 [Mollicutes bacterium LVI A0039]
MKKLFRNCLFSFMALMMIGQIVAPTVIAAAELDSELYETIATIEDFEQTDEGYKLLLQLDEESTVRFEYEAQNEITNFDFNLNEKALSLDQDNTLVKGENIIKITRKTADDELNIFNVNVQKKNLQNLDIMSEDAKSETKVSEEPATLSEISREATEVQDKNNRALGTSLAEKYHENLVDINANYGFEEFMEKGGLIGDYEVDYENEIITLIPSTENSAMGGLNSYFKIDGARPFDISADIKVTAQTADAADAVSFVFSGEDDPLKLGNPGAQFGIGGLADSFGLVWDYYNNTTDTASFEFADTNSDGRLWEYKNRQGTPYEVHKSTGAPKYKMQMKSDGTNISANLYMPRVRNITYTGPSKSDNDYFVRIATSQGANHSAVEVSNISVKADIVNLSDFSHPTEPDKKAKIEWGSEQEIEVTVANTLYAEQHLKLNKAALVNYEEKENSFYTNLRTSSENVLHEGVKLTDGYEGDLGAETSVMLFTTLKVTDPRGDRDTQLSLLADNSVQKASMKTSSDYSAFEYDPQYFDEHVLTGDPASFSGATRYVVPNLDVKDDEAVKKYILEESDITIDDPYLDEVTQAEILASPRVTIDPNYNAATDSNVVSITYLAINNETITREIEFFAEDLTLTKTVKDTGVDKNATDDVSTVLNGKAESGEQLEYTVTVSNKGVTPASNVVLTDTTDDLLDKSSLEITSFNDGTNAVSTDNYNLVDSVLTIKEIPGETTYTIVYTINVKSKKRTRLTQEYITNTVTAISDTLGATEVVAESQIELNKNAPGMSELAIGKIFVSGSDSIDKNDAASPKETLTYQVTLDNTNSSLDQDNVIITDEPDPSDISGTISNVKVIDGDTELEEGTDYSVSGNVVTISSIPSGSSYTLIYDVTAAAKFIDDSTISNKVTVVGDDVINTLVDSVEVEKDSNIIPGVDATIAGTDTSVKLADAPRTNAEVLKLINAQAYDIDGSSLISEITISDIGGYDISSPKVGEYTIHIGVSGSSGKFVKTSVNFKVVENNKQINDIDMYLTTPVFVENGNGLSDVEVVEQLIWPHVIETLNGDVQEPYAITSESLQSNGGYNNNQNGTYSFKFVATGLNSGLEVEEIALVTVAEDMSSLAGVATIDGQNIKVLQGSYYSDDVAAAFHKKSYPVATGLIYENGALKQEVALDASDVLKQDVNTAIVNKYQTIFYFEGETTDEMLVSNIGTFEVEVVEVDDSKNAVITATDSEVELSTAPKTSADLFTTLNANAFESGGDNIKDKIEIIDLGGYNFDAPALGTFEVTLGVVGNDGVKVTTTAIIKIVTDGTAVNEIDMLLNSPISVQKGNGLTDKEVVDGLITPQVLEKIGGVSNDTYAITSSSLVSNGGYDNGSNGTYTFKLVAKGLETGLEVEKAALVIVASDSTALEALATIDGDDIKILKGSFYDENVAANLHNLNYPTVTALVSEKAEIKQEVSLDASDIIASNVDEDTAGEYSTTFYFEGETSDENQVTALRNLSVAVVDPDFSKNAVLTAIDSEVEVSEAPKDNDTLIKQLQTEAFEANGVDISGDVEIINLGGYDLSSPTVGNYTITLSVVGSDGVKVTTTAILKVVADGEATNTIDMLLSSPVFVENSNDLTDAQVVDQLVLPYVLENLNGTAQEPYAISSTSLVSNGGYKNNTNGTYTFKLVAVGTQSGLEVEKAVVVVVSDDIADLDAVATIDGADIKVLEGSYYGKERASVLHKKNYDTVTAEVRESGTITPVELTDSDILATNVNTAKAGNYATTYRFESSDYSAPVSVVRNLNVEVVKPDISKDAVIAATDTEVELESAPETIEGLLTTLNAQAFEASGEEITSKIEVVDLGGYDFDARETGTYTITLSVVGQHNTLVRTKANLKVVDNGELTNEIDMLLSSPVFVEKGNGLTATEVVDQLIVPYIFETMNGTSNEPYAITSSSLVSDGGYDNNVNRTYAFKLVAEGNESGLEVEKVALVTVGNEIADLDAVATIFGKDITVLQGSYYSKEVAAALHQYHFDVVTVNIQESGLNVANIPLGADDIIATNVDTKTVGDYTTTYYFNSNDYIAPISATRNLGVKVISPYVDENAVITATDSEVELSNVPVNKYDLFDLLEAKAFESNNTDISYKIELIDIGGYDLSDPAVGTYTITLGVVGSDGVMVTTNADLTVVADGEATNKVEMLVSSPVFVENGNGLSDAEVVDELIVPYVLETLNGTSSEPYAITSSSLVSNGGYKNTTNGTYTFKLVATGVETGLEVEQTAVVIVASDITDLEAVATIDGTDIKVLEGSYYAKDVASVLHKDNYDVVTAEVNESGTVTPVGLTADNILATNVNTSATGTYTTTYRFASSDFAAPVSTIRNLAVEVVAADFSENAVITANDTEVELAKAPKAANDLVTTLSATASEADGTDITSKIEVVDFGGYDLSAPAEGNYTITLGVVGSDDVMVTTTANLKVVADGAATNKVEMLVSSPVFVENGNGLTDAEVVEGLILPYVLETIDGVANEPYAITSSSLVSNGGYDNKTNGTYTFKLVATGKETGLEVEQTALVVVAGDITDLEAVATIDGADIKVLEGSYYGKDVASVLHKDNYDVVTAEVNESGTVTPVGLTADNILATNVNTSATGTYTTTYRFASSDFAAPLSTIRNLAVEVIAADASKNAVISATDVEVELAKAPKAASDLVTTLNATAFEVDETDITSKIEVVDFGGYDLSAPAEGNYTITLGVVGSDDVMVTTTANLKVVADGAATNQVEMLVSSPVFVENGNGLTAAEVVEGSILPYVLETIDGVANEPYAITSSSLVSNGGYDNKTNGTYTFKLVATGVETGLEVEQTALVVVAGDITDLEAVATIDGADIKVLEGSYYAKDVASVLHADNYDVVTAEVTESGTVTPVGLTADNILATNVNTSATGTYTTTYRFASSDFAAPVSTVRNLAVEVVATDFSENAVITANDTEVELSKAPKAASDLVTTLNATASEADGTDITSKIEVVDFGGYDLSAPAEGNYTITLGVVGSDDVMVTTTANLKVVADGAATNKVEMLVSSPVFVENGNGLTDAEVVDELIVPYVLETLNGTSNEPYAITSSSLVSNGGYKNTTNGTYTFKLVATGVETGLEVEQTALVVVAGDITDLEAVATIDGADIKVLEGSYYAKDVASVLHKDNYDVVTAEVTEAGTVTPVGLTADNILVTNVNTSATGTYTTTYRFASSDYAAPVSVVRNLAVEVVAADFSENAVISASDAEVELSDAPTTVANLVTTLNATAFEADETDITSKIEVVDFGGYDLSAPAEGNYTITLGVVGSDDVMVTTTANLKVVADGAATNKVEMLVSSPVFVENGNGLTDAEVVEGLILPYVLETIDGVANEPYAITSSSLVSNGGYDNNTNGTYTFKLVATGVETGLEVEQTALVVVAGDITDLEAVATIDGADIKVLEGSYYAKDVASVLHKDNYDVVTAEVTESGSVTPVGLTADNILVTNVNTSATGTYTTTYRFASSDFAAPVSVVRNLAVEVVAADFSKNAVINATDVEVELSKAPKAANDLVTTLNATASEAEGTDITSKIEVVDFGGYDLSAPAEGNYTITLGVVGSDDVMVTTTANLKVVADGAATNKVEMLVSSPVFVENGNGLTDAEVVEGLILPYVLETIDGVTNEPYAITSSSLVSNGGYDNKTNGTYTFKLVATGVETGLEVEQSALVVVAGDITDLEAVATVDGADIKVLEGSYYAKDVASVLHKDSYDVVTAEVTESGAVTPVGLTADNIIATNVNTSATGTYTTTYRFASSDFAAPVSTIRNLAVEVVATDSSKNAVINATDVEVELANAPKTANDLMTTLNATAFEADETDITSKIEVVDFGGYDLSAPAEGNYTITLGVVGSDDVMVTTTANLKVVADGAATNKVEMLVSSPVFVENGNGLTDAEVVEGLILPYVLETIDGVANEPYAITSSSLVSNGGYDNKTNGTYTFKLVATGVETGLEVEQTALVVVAGDITDLEAVATIDGADIKVLEGSYYAKDVASVLHKDNYDVVTAEVTEAGTVTPVGLTEDNIIATNVNTSATGTYTTTYRFASNDFAAPVSVVRNLAVEVVASDFSKNAVVNASDAEVELSSAPKAASDLLTTLNAKAFEAKGTDITSKIEVVDFGGYDLSAPAEGNYTITLGVVGSDDVMVTTTANLKLVADGAATNNAEMLVSSPVFVENGNGLTDAEVVEGLILPYVLETIDGTSNEPYAITSSSLVSNGGYDNKTNGTYTFKLVATGVETGLEVEQSALVVVAGDITDLEAVATVDGADIKVLEGSYYATDVASVLHADNYDVVTAEVTESGAVTPVGLTADNILATNVNTSATGTYTTTYRFASSDYAAPVSVVRNLAVEVVASDFSENAVITANDTEVELSKAPKADNDIMTTLNATAFEADETDITSKIEVVDFGGYDLSSPAEGNYTITLGVVGSDDVMVTTTANLKVVADGAATNKAEMLVSSPVFVENGNGLTDAEVVEGLILPYVLETIDGTSNEPYAITSSSLVSNGGYDNNTNGTYTFKLVATGVETGLEVEQTALVVVASDITDVEAVATIDGADIKVLEGSYYAKDVASVLHKDSYDVVTAEVNESGTVTPVGLTADNIIATNVNTSATGMYTTTYRFESSDFAAPVSTMRNLAVEVVAADASKNAVINATDSELELAKAPKTVEDLLVVLNAKASEAEGTDITSKIEVVDFGEYDLSAPAEGNYTITLGVVGSDDVMVTTTANLKVVADGAATNKVEMLVSSPVFVENGNGLTDAEVVEGLILPYVLETIDGVANEPYAITSTSLVSNGGYANNTNGTYTFKLVATGVETGLEVEQSALVVVAGDITDVEAAATIDGADIKVLEGSYYAKDVASVLHKDNYDVVTAEVTESGTVTPVGLTADNILATNVNTSATGTYTTTYRFASSDYAAPVSVVRNLAVEVVAADASKNAVMNATDSELELAKAPKTVEDLLVVLNAKASEADGTDITSKIEVVDFGGYDLSAPAEGNYTITLGVVGSDDVMVTTTANLKVVADGAATNKVEMLVSSPVFVENGNGLTDAEVVEGLILPYVLETIDGVTNEPYAITSTSLVSNGGYDNKTNGTYTFKLVATGVETGLEVEQTALVVVASDITDLEAVATIDGADIKVLEGSYYAKDVASVLHKDNYDVVTSEVTGSGTVTPVGLTADNILATNVNTSATGTYTTTYRFASSDFAAPVSTIRNLAVEVVAADASKNAVINATDVEVELSEAPAANDLLASLGAKASEANGTDITSKIEVVDFGGYDGAAPAVGNYTITLGVVGSDDVMVTTTANLKVVADGETTNAIEMLVSSPVFVENGNGLTDAEVVEGLILLYVLETIDGVANEPYAITSSSLVSNGGYNNNTNGTYTFKLVATGVETGLEVEQTALVVVASNITNVEAVATIDGADIKVLEGSYYSKDVASVLHKDNYDVVTAEVTESGATTPVALTDANVLTTNVDTKTAGTYVTTYRFASSDFAAPVSVMRNLNVEVVEANVSENAVITATDIELELAKAPKAAEDLLVVLNAKAFEVGSEDITSKIKLIDLGGYDLSAPTVGTYTITLGVAGSDDVMVTTNADLTVVADGEATNKVEMLVSTPVFVENGNGLSDAEVVDQLIVPYVLETMGVTINEPYAITSTSIVSNGGYDNTIDGTYTFKLVAVGTESGLEVEQTAVVIVASDITDLDAVATIDGADIKVLEGSYYAKDVASVLHKDSYDVVTSEVNESGAITPVALTAANILATNVNTAKAGTYATTFQFASSDFAAPVSVVRNLDVEVIKANVSKNAVITATDAEIELSNTPTSKETLLMLIQAKALEVDGTDITSKIEVVDLGGYDLSAPTPGTYILILSVIGKDGVKVTTTATITVVVDGEQTNAINMLLSSPVYVENGNGLSDEQVVEGLILPYVLETLNGTSNEPYAISSMSLVSNGGYNNNANGTYTFKLVATGVETGLEVEKAAVVIVANDITNLDAVATIDGADIKVLEGSYYSKDVASVLHKDNYDVVTAEVNESGTVTPVGLTDANVLTTNVDTKTAGTYVTTYRFESSDFAAPLSVMRNLAVEVVAADASKNAVINATDAVVELSEAPAVEAVLTTLGAEAFEANGTDITSKIEVVDFGGYDLSAPSEGNYTITLGVVGSDDVMVTTTANLKVVADGEATNSIEMLFSSPVFVENGNGLTDKQVVDQLILPYVLETINGLGNEPYAITSSSLVSNGGYNNNANGTYTFKLVATGVETGLEVEKAALVVVADDITDLDAVATIDGADIKVLEGSYYSKDVASTLHKDRYDAVTAEVTESGTINSKALTSTNIIATNVNTTSAGTYTTTYSFGSSEYAATVSVVRNLTVEVVKANVSNNAVITATDSEIEQSNAPKTNSDLIDLLNVEAFEPNGTDITQMIDVVDMGGYDLSAPKEGTYTITLGVVGSDGVVVTTTANITVVVDGAETNMVEMLVSSPVYVENGNGLSDAEVVDQLLVPHVLETLNGTVQEPYAITSSSLVSNGGYDNKTNGTYTFKLTAVGNKSGLEVEKTAFVIVANDITELNNVVRIDGSNIKVPVGSNYSVENASQLHANNYDVVTVEVYKDRVLSDEVALDSSNIISSDVDTSKVGTYSTVYFYTENINSRRTTDEKPLNTIKRFEVSVVADEEALSELELTKQVTDEDNDNQAEVNELISYVINVSNNSTNTVFNDVVISDDFSSQYLDANKIENIKVLDQAQNNVTNEVVSIEEGSLVVDISYLMPDEQITISFDQKLSSDLVDGDSIDNMATVTFGNVVKQSNNTSISVSNPEELEAEVVEPVITVTGSNIIAYIIALITVLIALVVVKRKFQ